MISYTITVCDEHSELEKLLNYLRVSLRNSDEIILQMDSEKVTERVKEVSENYRKQIPCMKVVEFPLGNDFASFKNNLKQHCSNDWIFNIDADEMPSRFLVENLHQILSHNNDIDVLIVPRWNVVEGITESHIDRWRWRFDDLGRINWPDWQMRIYRNKEQIKWKNKVHEKLDGFDKYAMLPEDKDYCLFHNKSIQRQEKQNELYDTMM